MPVVKDPDEKDYVAEFAARAETEKKLREKLPEFASPQWQALLEDEFVKLENELRVLEARQQARKEGNEFKQEDAWWDERIAKADEDRKRQLLKKKKAVHEHRSMREQEEKLAAIDKSHRKIDVLADMYKKYTDTPNLPGDHRWPPGGGGGPKPPARGGPASKNDDDRKI